MATTPKRSTCVLFVESSQEVLEGVLHRARGLMETHPTSETSAHAQTLSLTAHSLEYNLFLHSITTWTRYLSHPHTLISVTFICLPHATISLTRSLNLSPCIITAPLSSLHLYPLVHLHPTLSQSPSSLTLPTLPPCITLFEHEQELNRCQFIGVSECKIGDYKTNDKSDQVRLFC